MQSKEFRGKKEKTLRSTTAVCSLCSEFGIVFWLGVKRMKNADQGVQMAEGKNDRISDLQERLIQFAVRVLNVVESLPTNRIGNHVGGQLLRSGTSPAPNYGEAQSAESRKDFIHKMKISLKELRETHVWLRIIQSKPLCDSPDRIDLLQEECNELIAIFVSSINTAQKNLRNEK